MNKMPRWADVALIPFINLLIAFIISGLVLAAIGTNPFEALATMIKGSFGSTRGVGYTLYYSTNFIFTGLAMAIASHARMFNIGGEGQAAVGGLGVAIILLALPWPHWTLALPAAVVFGGLFGAAWAFIPAYLQAKRGSHIVITTIMFNFMAAAVTGYLLTGPMKVKGKMAAETASFPEGAHLPTFHEMLSPFGIEFSKHAPANISFLVALLCCLFFWVLMWHTRLGYQIRALGHSESASKYAGISPAKIMIITMLISGAFAGLMAVNNVMGEAERMIHNAVEGAGFIGIAVALMGRNHPVGVILAAILFGFLWQGGAELQFEYGIPREMVTVIQAIVIMLTGALDYMVRGPVERIFIMRANAKGA